MKAWLIRYGILRSIPFCQGCKKVTVDIDVCELSIMWDTFKEKYKSRIGECYIIHPRNLSIKDDVLCIPPYMTMCL